MEAWVTATTYTNLPATLKAVTATRMAWNVATPAGAALAGKVRNRDTAG